MGRRRRLRGRERRLAGRLVLAGGGVAAAVAVTGVVVSAARDAADDRADSPALAAVASLTIDAPRTRLAPGDTVRLAATPRNPVDQALPLRAVRWATNDSTIAAVSPDGVVRAGRPGTVILEASSESQTAEVAVTVVGRADTVVLHPGDDLRARVRASPDGTVFRLTPGLYRGQSVVPKNGMAFVGEPGAVLTGEDRAEYAFGGNAEPYPRNVVVRGLVIEHYASPPQAGAVRADVAAGAWTVEDCEVRDNAGGGILVGPRARVLRNRVHHNGQIGVSGGGDAVLVEGNEIAYNNPRGAFDMYWEAGGTKFARTRDLVVRGNFVHHNRGPGLWTDVDNVRTLYERNRVEDNAESGILHEVSYSAVIRDNQARRNGAGATPPAWVSGAGIQVNASPDVEVYGNTVEDNHTGITAVEDDRGRGAYGPHALRDLRVHHNTVRMREGATGVAAAGWWPFADGRTYDPRRNRFEANRYVLGANARYFRWRNGWRTAAEWRAAGQDVGGTFGR